MSQADKFRDRLASLCDELSRWPSLEMTVRDGGAGRELHELLVLMDGELVPDPATISVLIDAVEEACNRQGLAGLTSRQAGMPAIPAGVTAVATVAGWTCPKGRCTRVVTPDETTEPPICAVTGGRPMAPYDPAPP